MNRSEVFGAAQWVCAGAYAHKTSVTADPAGTPHFPVLRSRFAAGSAIKKATLRVLGLGFFHCYINGRRVSEDQFLPLNTDFEARDNYPTNEVLTGHRIYVPEFDVTSLLHPGENTLALHFGGGWYTFNDAGDWNDFSDGGDWFTDPTARFGDPKAIFRLVIEDETGAHEAVSSTADRIGASFVATYHFTQTENQDYTAWDDACLGEDFNDAAWPCAQPAKEPDTEYLFSDCPADRFEPLTPAVCLLREGDTACYDAGKNASQIPVLRITAPAGEKVTVYFSEARTPEGKPHCAAALDNNDRCFGWNQSFSVISDGKERIVQPAFTWFGFRYFSVTGSAEVLGTRMVHTDVAVTAEFECDNDDLNWMFQAFVNTQLSNMHAGIPSDCPHIERRGYTGDGQLICHAAMDILDARAFYRKWIEDIGDCQDTVTGHVQYTAPYTRCGGGPGGWGCAIVEVPWQYYLHYGDIAPADRLYPQMLRYFDFLEAHSENGLVTSDKAGQWCLGDWCTPIQVALPAPFVNNYFYIRSLLRTIEIAKLTGREADIPMLEARVEARRAAVKAAYFNTWDSNFIGGLQGANAFALDMGVGDETTLKNMVKYYTADGCYDTGIFGTEIVTRVLFERGEGELAARLMTARTGNSYAGMRDAGATTLWEYWPAGNHIRSLNHPMFGAVAGCLFDWLLGIQGTPGYTTLRIAPVLPSCLQHARGKRVLPTGEVRVAWQKKDGTAEFTVTVPEGVPAVLVFNGTEYPLTAGENRISAAL